MLTDPVTGRPFHPIMAQRARTIFERYDDSTQEWIEVMGAVCGECHIATVVGYPHEDILDLQNHAKELGWKIENNKLVCPSNHREKK